NSSFRQTKERFQGTLRNIEANVRVCSWLNGELLPISTKKIQVPWRTPAATKISVNIKVKYLNILSKSNIFNSSIFPA
ncbi:MAG: hypothetical protein LBK83_13600, partial [Treponema sp.]|nr:hypothetical protein [Treponema sp.]